MKYIGDIPNNFSRRVRLVPIALFAFVILLIIYSFHPWLYTHSVVTINGVELSDHQRWLYDLKSTSDSVRVCWIGPRC